MENTVRNLMFDLASGCEIYDDEQGRVISKKEASEAIRKVCFEELGLSENASEKQIKRALKSEKGIALMEVIEEVIEQQIAYGISENEFFNQFVETKNLKDGDRNEFWVDNEVLLTVSKVSGDHHDLTMQRLGSGTPYSVPTAMYGIKVGGDIRLFLTGRKDWTALTDAVAKAFMRKMQNLISTQFANGVNIIPVPATLTGTGALAAGTKTQFDAIIEKVEAANECPAVIMGTKTALKNLNNFYTNAVNWADSQKEAVAHTGILGDYEGTELIEIPQKFEDKTLATPIVDNGKLYIMPKIDNKFIKFVDGGEVELTIDKIGDTMDDMQSYEVQRRVGVATLMTRYFGVWTF